MLLENHHEEKRCIFKAEARETVFPEAFSRPGNHQIHCQHISVYHKVSNIWNPPLQLHDMTTCVNDCLAMIDQCHSVLVDPGGFNVVTDQNSAFVKTWFTFNILSLCLVISYVFVVISHLSVVTGIFIKKISFKNFLRPFFDHMLTWLSYSLCVCLCLLLISHLFLLVLSPLCICLIDFPKRNITLCAWYTCSVIQPWHK